MPLTLLNVLEDSPMGPWYNGICGQRKTTANDSDVRGQGGGGGRNGGSVPITFLYLTPDIHWLKCIKAVR